MLDLTALKSVVDRLSYPMIIWDIKGNCIFSNKESNAIFCPEAINPNEIINIALICKSVYRSDKEELPIGEHELPIKQSIIDGVEMNKVPMFIKNESRPDGIYVEADSYAVKDASGVIIGCVSSFRDVSEKIKMQNLLDELEKSFNHMQLTLIGVIKESRIYSDSEKKKK